MPEEKKSQKDTLAFRRKVHKNRQYYKNINWTARNVEREVQLGLKFLNEYPNPMVTFLGGARVLPEAQYYKLAYSTAKHLAKNGASILTGGGSGVMEAANRGAYDAGGVSLGIKAQLIKGEEVLDDIYTGAISLHFIFVRRFLLAIESQALVFFPGGYGTLSEFFEFLVLIKLQISDEVPLIFVNRRYWQGLIDWMHESPAKYGMVATDIKDIPNIKFAENHEQIVRFCKEGF